MKNMKNKGLHLYRFRDNPEDKRFAQACEKHDKDGKTLEYLLCEGDQRHLPEVSPRERTIAATVIQWLGSPVGQNFLDSLGYEKKKGPEVTVVSPPSSEAKLIARIRKMLGM